MKTLRSLSIAVLVALAAVSSHASDAYLLYDLTTKQVSAPLVFWRSNLLAGAEITWTYTGNLPSPVLADSITRDTELAAAIAGLSGTYQPLNTHLSDLADGSLSGAKVGSGINGDNITTGTIADARIAATIARLASPALTGTPTAPTPADGTSNTVVATTAFVLRNGGGGGGGGGTGNANTNNPTAWADSTSVSLYDLAIRGTATIANLSIGSASYSGVWGFANGGHGATTAAGARTALGLEKDVDVQTFRLPLLQFHVALAADGDMPYRNASGIITNAPSTTAGRALLTAANAAAQRSSMGVPALAGDTFTGAIRVPGDVYDASSWTNGSKTNEVPTKADVARKIEALSVGGYIASVASDFQVSASQLSVTNTVGSGRIVRETATGATASMSGLSDVSISSTNNLHKQDYFSWSGSNWVQTLGPMGWSAPDQWEEITCNFQGAWTGSGFARTTVSSGAQSDSANSIHGRVGYWSARAPTSTTTFWGGANCVAGSSASFGNSNFIPTNEFFGKFEVLLPTTNGVRHVIGFHDGLDSTNAPTDALYVAVTNGLAYFVASMGGNTTKASSTYVWATNYWHNIIISATNQVATVRVTTNGVVAWQESINSSNIPGGGTVATGFGVNTFTDGSGVSTNNENLLILKRCGLRYRTY